MSYGLGVDLGTTFTAAAVAGCAAGALVRRDFRSPLTCTARWEIGVLRAAHQLRPGTAARNEAYAPRGDTLVINRVTRPENSGTREAGVDRGAGLEPGIRFVARCRWADGCVWRTHKQATYTVGGCNTTRPGLSCPDTRPEMEQPGEDAEDMR
jgi:hypothetical protein